MHEPLVFGLIILVTAAAALLAVQSQVITQWVRVPAPALFLAAAALVARLPAAPQPSHQTVERVVTLALMVILFDGGLHIGLKRIRTAAPAVLSLGVLGTFATVGGGAVLVHATLGVSWYLSVLVAAAIAPTDPAVVFSVLGQREVGGSSGTILEGESGANDPVGIALMTALIGAGSLNASADLQVGGTFVLQMVVGATVGVLGARLLLWIMRSVPLSAEGLHPVRVLVATGVLFGLATVAHGSGFLAVFVAGILLGDERAPFKRDIERFHSALASLAEIVAFAILGFTVNLDVLARLDVWGPGLIIGIGLSVLVRPVFGLPLLLPVALSARERAFVLFAGLKGAVPLLLGTLLLPLPDGARLYGVVVVVVMLSVVLQGSLVPTVARLLRIEMRTIEQQPYQVGVRLRDAPPGAARQLVEPGSPAEGRSLSQLLDLLDGTWIQAIVRDASLVPVRSATVLQAGDEVLILLDPDQPDAQVLALFTSPSPDSTERKT